MFSLATRLSMQSRLIGQNIQRSTHPGDLDLTFMKTWSFNGDFELALGVANHQFDPEFPVYSPKLLEGGDATSSGVTSDDSIYVGGLVWNSIPHTLMNLTSTGAVDGQFLCSNYGNSVYNFLILPNGDSIVLGDFVPQSDVHSRLARIVGLSSTKTVHLSGKMLEG